MNAAMMQRVWQILGVVLILYGLFALFSGDGSEAVIFLGGGSAALLLLARKKGDTSGQNEASQ